MTVASTGLRKEYTGNGVATSFAYDWKISNKAHLLVTRVTIADDTETTLTVDTDYTVSGVANPSGGTVIPTVLLSSAYRLVITSNVPAEQQTGFTNQNTVPPQTVEDAMDKLTIIVKQMLETLSRAVTVSVGSDLSPTDYIAELESLLTQAQAAQAAAAASQSSASSSAATATAQAVIATARAVLAAASAAQFQGTSATSITVGTGSKVFTTQAGKLFNGEYVQAYSAADPTKFMNGICTYTGTTLTVTVDSIGAAGGPYTDWVIKVSGAKGATGPTGPTGPAGSAIQIATCTGDGDTIAADFSPDLTLTDGLMIAIVANNNNSVTNPTLNVDGTGAKTIKKKGGASLVSADIATSSAVHLLCYRATGTYWELLNPASVSEVDLKLSDNTVANVSTAKHGLVPKLTNTGTNFFRDDGTYAAVPSSAGGATTTSSGSSINLTNSSNRIQQVSMTAAGLYVKLPDATTLSAAGGPIFIIRNNGTFMFVVIDNGGRAKAILKPGEAVMLSCSDTSTAAGVWAAGNTDQNPGMNEILMGTIATAVQAATAGASGTSYWCSAYISDTKFLFVWQDNTATVSIKCAVISITNADTLSAGTAATVVSLASLSGVCACDLDGSNVLVGYHGTSNTSVVCVGISGTTATVGTSTSVVATTSGNMHLFKMSSTSAFCGFVTSTTSKGVVISSISTAGSTVNAVTTCRTSSTTEGALAIAQIDANTYFYAVAGTTAYLDVQVVTVSGTTVTANTALANNSNTVAVTNIAVIAISSTFVVVFHNTGNGVNYVTFSISGTTITQVMTQGVPNFPNTGGPALPMAATRIGPYVVLACSVASWSGYYYTVLYHFKVDPNTKSCLFTHQTMNGEYNFQQLGGRPWLGYVSPGKYCFGYTTQSGTQHPYATIYHGLT